ncbi:hypothetical protein WI61_14870 [Burkholderia cepacia]|uniref:hypothetical protein n=1 Tax=Burkholderia cepacia TaxID=292 RepID=UPI0007557CA9|nr:hypothetical protein [Burkholderia cepacia]KVA68649.1 hypothetical protein WI48_31260 [Burkholderia cepacia]KVA93692.1 hypothetical protein WI52_03725 [Burkholderia cepacia]KVA95078.1 hypothetical protein WI51_03355 [Burkholderia cepacia]KVB02223.1 hypothetical protein WI55_28000 [Burkholderia cepacia]KVB21671.1 hypothetical protein WI57_25885 [Burkholderia cepacia]
MTLNAQGYFNCLKSYLNTNHYGEPQATATEVRLKEKVFGQSGNKPIEYNVTLRVTGETLVIKLDAKKNGSSLPLFHFLDDNAKPWSKRCDFVVFNLRKSKLYAYCLEFKSESIPHDVSEQLKSSVDWIKALHATINAYTTKRSVIQATKFVLSNHQDPTPYLDADGKYLLRDHTIRHYRYADVNGMALTDFENSNIEVIR